ncbi:MAG: response regulator [Lachnospiraceae bacterium]|nr:response regulator [Lachnospiraceae bacterium]
MYKIIIADDEKFIQDGLVKLVDWKSLGFEIAGVFDDGTEVIECLNSMPIDVVFTDVKMKYISGIDIARYIYDNKIPCKVVFISGYKEFDLIHQAIKYNVEDYVLKPSKVEDVKNVFKRIRIDLDEKSKNLEFGKKVEARWAELKPILEEQFINELVMGTLHDKNSLQQKLQMLYPEINAEQNPCMIADFVITDYDEFILGEWKYGKDQFDEAIYNFIKIMDNECYCHVIYKNKEQLRMFIMAKKLRETWEENMKLCNEICESFVGQFQEVFHVKATITPVRYYESMVCIMDHNKNSREVFVSKTEIGLMLKEQKKIIMTNIMMGNISTAKKMVINILLSMDINDIKCKTNFLIDIFFNISNFLQENNQALYMRVQPYLDYHNILNLEDDSHMVEVCNQIFDVMKSNEAMSAQFDKSSLVNRMMEYVDLHIYDDINLEDVANELFISSSQLNRILKKQIGETFLQLVTKRKMEKAAELLRDPQYKVYQVGERLGYKTPRHFSKLFQNFSGYYPNQYRNEVLKLGDGVNEER